mmetsp:Transcript_1879/g.5478  ORF Transcript_1879/g.5478 Transcript_1879/m.5478 type:complete len:929 (-) Transcript_1879:65-2851(-)
MPPHFPSQKNQQCSTVQPAPPPLPFQLSQHLHSPLMVLYMVHMKKLMIRATNTPHTFTSGTPPTLQIRKRGAEGGAAQVNLDSDAIQTCLLRAVASRVCSSAPRSLDSGGIDSIVCSLHLAFPHYSIAASGSWTKEEWGGADFSSEAFCRNPQFRLTLDLPATLAMHLTMDDGVPSDMDYQLSIQCFQAREDSGWEVVFADPIAKHTMQENSVISAWVHLQEGCYVVVPTLADMAGSAGLGFRLAFASQTEVEVEKVPLMQGWDTSSCAQKINGSWDGFWKGGDNETSPFFWRNPQVLLHRQQTPSLSASNSKNIYSHESSEFADEMRPMERLILTVCRQQGAASCVPESSPSSLRGDASPSLGLAVFTALHCPGVGDFKRHVGEGLMLGEGRPHSAAAFGRSIEATTLVSNDNCAVVEVKLPDYVDDLVLVPFHGRNSSKESMRFSMRCFSTMPGLELRPYSRGQEWALCYTFKLRWGPEKQAQLRLQRPGTPQEEAQQQLQPLIAPVAVRFPGIREGCTVDVSWREAALGAGSGGAPLRRAETAAAIPLCKTCLTCAVGTSSYCEISMQLRDATAADKVLMVQLLSDVPLDQSCLPKDTRCEDIVALLPCPIGLASPEEAGAEGAGDEDVALVLRQENGPVLSAWGKQAARSKDTAKQVRNMVAELKQQVMIMKKSHMDLKQEIGRATKSSLRGNVEKRPRSKSKSFAGILVEERSISPDNSGCGRCLSSTLLTELNRSLEVAGNDPLAAPVSWQDSSPFQPTASSSGPYSSHSILRGAYSHDAVSACSKHSGASSALSVDSSPNSRSCSISGITELSTPDGKKTTRVRCSTLEMPRVRHSMELPRSHNSLESPRSRNGADSPRVQYNTLIEDELRLHSADLSLRGKRSRLRRTSSSDTGLSFYAGNHRKALHSCTLANTNIRKQL